MTFPILGGNGAVAGYSIDNSLRLNQGDTPHLDKTFSSAGTSNKIGTLSFWYKRTTVGNIEYLFHVYPNRSGHSNDRTFIAIGSDNKLAYERIFEGSTQSQIKTTQLFRDVSAWYHFTIVFDTTQSTASDRLKIYLNGNQITDFSTTNYPAQNLDIDLADAHLHTVGAGYNGSYIHPTDGYLAEYHYIDGTAKSPTDFGEFDSDSGIWKPISYSGSYGTNGFYLDFENSGSLGADQSGNGNNFTPTNLASTDQTTDTPTNNFATFNPLYVDRFATRRTLSEGNCEVDYPDTGNDGAVSLTQAVNSGKWYVEMKVVDSAGFYPIVGSINENASQTVPYGRQSTGLAIAYDTNGTLKYENSNTSYGNSVSNGDIFQIALDMDNHLLWFGINGTWQNSATQTEIENSTATNDATTKVGEQTFLTNYDDITIFVTDVNSNGTANIQLNTGNPPFSISSGNSDGNGYGNFEYAPPSGYLALCTQNLATALSPTIDDGSQYFNTVLYTGDGNNSRTVTGTGFQPDWAWIKVRNTGYAHKIFDSSRGAGKRLMSQSTNAEATVTDELTSFDSDGFTTNNNAGMNENTRPYVAWQWLANGGTTSSNTDGSITSTVQANTTAGFSVVTYTGNATAGATIGHGLGVKPDMIILKPRSNSANWLILHQAYEGTSAENMRFTTMALASADSQNSSGWFRTAPTSSVFYVGNGVAGDYTSSTNQSGATHVAYCFADIEGYSKFGSYTGNGSSDGTFVYTGFRPAFVIVKRTDSSNSWTIRDSKRSTFNVMQKSLFADLANAEADSSNYNFDFLSNGFKQRNSNGIDNASGGTYIYMAFAENPFVDSNGIPVTAR